MTSTLSRHPHKTTKQRQQKPKPWWKRSLFPTNLYLVVTVVLWWIYRPFPTLEQAWPWWQCVLVALGFVCLLIGAHILDHFVRRYLRVEQAASNKLVQRLVTRRPLLSFLFIIVWAPLTEEFAYRYVVVGLTYETPWLTTAMVVSCLLFGAAHGELKYLKVLLGAGLMALYMWTGTLWTSILTHALINLAAWCAMMIHLKAQERAKQKAADDLKEALLQLEPLIEKMRSKSVSFIQPPKPRKEEPHE